MSINDLKFLTGEKLNFNFSAPREHPRIPTAANSEFYNKQQLGDWAERKSQTGLTSFFPGKVVRYGQSLDMVAGEAGFKKHYQLHQEELDKVGKRPDLLVFPDTVAVSDDIRDLSLAELNQLVPLATAGIEVRSSNYRYWKYVEYKKKIQVEDDVELSTLQNKAKGFPDCPIDLYARINSKKMSPILVKILKQIKTLAKKPNNNDLSFTVKFEDLQLVFKWIETYGVPHYYCQVFWDSIHIISFLKILELVNNGDFSLDKDVKNQFKNTIKVNIKHGQVVAHSICPPKLTAKIKECEGGRVLPYIEYE